MNEKKTENDEVTEELMKIYEGAEKDGIWLREWAGGMAAAGWMADIEKLEKKTRKKIDVQELDLGECVMLAVSGGGATREEACRIAIRNLKENYPWGTIKKRRP